MDETTLGAFILCLSTVAGLFIMAHDFLKRETAKQNTNHEEIIRNQDHIEQTLAQIRQQGDQIKKAQEKLENHEIRIIALEYTVNHKKEEHND